MRFEAAIIDPVWISFNGYTPTWGSDYFDYADYRIDDISVVWDIVDDQDTMELDDE